MNYTHQKNKPLKYIFAVILSLGAINIFAQDGDLMDMLNDNGEEKNQPVIASFKTTRVINSHSTKTLGKKNLDFRITHRFGNIGGASGGGIHSFYGFDSASNIRFSFEYGILDNLMVGIGRSKIREDIDGFVKWRFLTQTTNNKVPLSVAVMLNTAVTPMKDVNDQWTKFLHRVTYTSQLVIARKFGQVGTLEILPTYVHRNYVPAATNPSNGAEETNGLFALGAAGRIKITGSASILFDYYYTFSDYRKDNTSVPYYMPLGVGFEIETGGHVFHMNFTNSAGIIENHFLTSSVDSWEKGGFKFGFNISRVWTLGGKKKKNKE